MMLKFFRDFYLVIMLTMLGVMAFVTATLVSWPAIAHLASKLN